MKEPIELAANERRKILRQHRDLRRVLEATLSATEDTESAGTRKLSVLVGLALRLQNMLERHFTFEETILLPHFLAEDPARVDRMVNDHRRQRAELSVLAKLAFQKVGLARVGQAFRCLIHNMLAEMDDEERELLSGVRRRTVTGPVRTEIPGDFPGDIRDECGMLDSGPAVRRSSS
jgi:iron-sulfur cluster repair protein YtfE (RIC family)